MRIKISIEQVSGLVVLRYRAYYRKGVKTISYVARITGPHPDFVLARSFVERYCRSNSRWDEFACCVDEDGIYEIVIKRRTEDGVYLSRERKWLVVESGRVYLYEDEEMNAQYVLYCAWLISPNYPLCA